MSEAEQLERVNFLAPLGAPGFDMDSPLQFRIFDPQISGELQDDWLAYVVRSHGVTQPELAGMLASKLLRRWDDGTGKEGFLLYTEQQALMAKRLQLAGRHSEAELKHIFGEWNEFLEILSEEDLAYDDMDVDDYEHFRRRTREMTEFFESDIARMEAGFCPVPANRLEAHKAEARKRHAEWRRTRDYLANRPDSSLTSQQRERWRSALHEIRFTDEMSRIMLAQPFMAQVEQGYSVEVSFRSWETTNYTTTIFGDIAWALTLDRFRATRNEGKLFPLRTPDFNLTENGIELLAPLTPDRYKSLHERYRLDELSELLAERGSELWKPDLEATGRKACPECGAIFERITASRQYCSERCRGRAKSRLWRESDPERARRAQAKHYKEAYPQA